MKCYYRIIVITQNRDECQAAQVRYPNLLKPCAINKHRKSLYCETQGN